MELLSRVPGMLINEEDCTAQQTVIRAVMKFARIDFTKTISELIVELNWLLVL